MSNLLLQCDQDSNIDDLHYELLFKIIIFNYREDEEEESPQRGDIGSSYTTRSPYDQRPQRPEVTDRPQRLPQPPRPQHGYIDVRIDLQVSRFSLNKKIIIPCTVNSYSAPNVSWKFNGRPLRSSQRVQVQIPVSILINLLKLNFIL